MLIAIGAGPSQMEDRHLGNNRAASWKMSVGANNCFLNAMQLFWVLNNWHLGKVFHKSYIAASSNNVLKREQMVQTKQNLESSHLAQLL